MAILNNLIVNGNSRILNTLFCKNLTISGTTTFSTITVSSTATFNGSVTFNSSVNVKGTSIEIFGSSTQQTPYIDFHHNNSSADYTSRIIESESGKLQIPKNFQVVGTMTTSSINNSGLIFSENINVANTLRATRFDLQTISSTGGSLYVSPTVKYPNSGTTLGVAKSGSTLTLTITDSSITSTTMAGVVWAANSKVKVSGEINGVPTGTMDGTVTSINTSSHVMVVTASGENSGSVAAGTYSASQFANLSVMIYQRRDGSNDYRVGIWLNCYDIQNSSATIRIYAGNSVTPNVMLGNLTGAGLGTVNNLTPEGWGLFAQNAFLHGRIVSTSGLIGGWTLDSNSLYNGTWGTENGAMFCTGTTSAKSIGGSASISGWTLTSGAKFGVTKAGVLYCSDAHVSGQITATSGKIGGWTIESNAIEKHTDLLRIRLQAMDSPTDGNYAIRVDTRTSTSADWANKIALGYGGYFYAGNATIVGTITANTGYIGGTSGWTIASQQLSNGTIGSDSSMFLGTKNLGSSTSIAGRAGSDWRLTVGSHFGVTNTGAIYANTGQIGGWTIGTSSLSSGTYGSDNSLFMSTADMASKAIAGTTLSTWRFTVGSHFGVTNTGAIYANTGNISGWKINSTSIYNDFNASSTVAYWAGLEKPADATTYVFKCGHAAITNGTRGSWGWDFYVKTNGEMYCNKANIIGTIDATSIQAKDSFSLYASTSGQNGPTKIIKVGNWLNGEYAFSIGLGLDYNLSYDYFPKIDFTFDNSKEKGEIYIQGSKIDLVADTVRCNSSRITTASEIHSYNADSYAFPAAKNCSSGTNTNFGSITLAAGLYIIEYGINFASNSSGRREAWLSESSTGTNINRYARTNQQATNGATTFVHDTFISAYTTSKTFYLVGYQNSGSTLSCTAGIRAIRLINGTDYGSN